ITPDGHIFLVDFGLAKVVQGSQATTTGARAMTPGYSPPEQYGTARTDPRTDIYSLGATLYASLTGIIPEDGLARAMDNAQLTPLRKRNSKVSRRLAQVIEKAMAIDPVERYQNGDDFKKALLGSKSKTQKLTGDYVVTPPPAAGEGEPPAEPAEPRGAKPVPSGPKPAPPPEEKPFKPPRRRRQRNGCAMPILILLFVVAAAVVAWFAVPDLPAQVTHLLGLAPTATKKPPATFTQLPSSPESPTEIPALLFTATPILPTFTFTPEFTFTPLPTETPLATLTPSPTPVGGGYGQFAFASDRTGAPQIYLADAREGAAPRPLTNIALGACQPAWSPDGLKIAFTSPCAGRDGNFKNATIYLMDADGSNIVPLLAEPRGDFDPAWSPDGARIAFVSVRDGRPRIYMADVAAGTVASLTEPAIDVDEMRYPAWSPFGNQLTYTVKRVGVYQIWVMSDTGNGQEQVVRIGQDYWDMRSVWSPDGDTIWFSRRWLGGGGKFYLVNIRYEERYGEGARQDFGNLPIFNVHFSPDGFWLIFEGEAVEGNPDIFIMTASGASRARLTLDPAADFDPAWRPIATP
ncbi:MAG: hypothetical protein AB1750_19000, partial [Chloroflexota bacterium]